MGVTPNGVVYPDAADEPSRQALVNLAESAQGNVIVPGVDAPIMQAFIVTYPSAGTVPINAAFPQPFPTSALVVIASTGDHASDAFGNVTDKYIVGASPTFSDDHCIVWAQKSSGGAPGVSVAIHIVAIGH